jgi:hypothetical protein
MTRPVRLPMRWPMRWIVSLAVLGTVWLGNGAPALRAQPRSQPRPQTTPQTTPPATTPQAGAAQPGQPNPANQPAQAPGTAPSGPNGTAGTPGSTGEGAGEDGTGEDGATAAPDQEALDIDALRQEYLRLRDELFRSRARAAAVASALYSTRLRIHLDHESARFYTITRSTIRLDGANVYDDSEGAIGADRAVRFEGFVAPGSHRVGVRIEATGKDDERFASVVENTFTLEAPAGKDVIVRIRARDAGDIAYAWEKKQRGSYKLQLDIAVETATRKGQDKQSAARPPARASGQSSGQASDQAMGQAPGRPRAAMARRAP